ncbi:MAG: DNA polymerase IV [Candidatus Terrybacteria bacterium]|nr:DNA polymerase IV [Candidatus Terrybacteria bacterium]
MPPAGKRIVLHLDMDAFFAAIEERDHPDFAGFPVVVGADPQGGGGRGVVSTANYEARKYGVHSAQPISHAWRLCKKGEQRGGRPCVFFRGSFEKYDHESDGIMKIVRKYAGTVEQTSVDEAYFELPVKARSSDDRYAEAIKIARLIKRRVLSETKLTCSIGVGPNKLIAKIASDYKKPDGLTIVRSGEVRAFLDPLSVRVIPGIGPKAEEMLRAMNIRIVRELRGVPDEMLTERFGVWGREMAERAKGRDDRAVGGHQAIKSLGREHTFDEDARDPIILLATLRWLAEQVAQDAREASVKFKNIELKVRLASFETRTRRVTLRVSSSSARIIENNTLRLFLPFLDRRENPHDRAIRLLGVRVAQLTLSPLR